MQYTLLYELSSLDAIFDCFFVCQMLLTSEGFVQP